jgi:hypothetical protein
MAVHVDAAALGGPSCPDVLTASLTLPIGDFPRGIDLCRGRGMGIRYSKS